MNLTKDDVKFLVEKYRKAPTKELYTEIKAWYDSNANTFPDKEFAICIFMFMSGANIAKSYYPMSKADHLNTVKYIRELLDTDNQEARLIRKTYFDYGSKSGYYR